MTRLCGFVRIRGHGGLENPWYGKRVIVNDAGGVTVREVLVELPSVEQVQRFVGVLTPLEGDFELLSGQFVLDARSLMAIFGLDLSKPVQLRIYCDNERNMAAIRPFLAETEGNAHEQ